MTTDNPTSQRQFPAGHGATDRVRAHIAASWDKTVRTSPDDPTHVRVPYPYTVPSIAGAFQEMYYWDTYFTDRGLLLDGRLELEGLKTCGYEKDAACEYGNPEMLGWTAGVFVVLDEYDRIDKID